MSFAERILQKSRFDSSGRVIEQEDVEASVQEPISPPQTVERQAEQVLSPAERLLQRGLTPRQPETPIGESEFLTNLAKEQEPSTAAEIASTIGRGLVRAPVRAGEALAGLPGATVQLAKGIAESLPEVPSFLQGEDTFVRRGLRSLVEAFPTPGELREGTRQLAKSFELEDVLEPQGRGEELFDEIIGDAAILALPVKGKIPFARAIGTSLAANLTAEGAEEIGLVGEKGKALTKIGVMLFSGLINRPKTQQLRDELYKEADALLPPGAVADATKLEKDLNSLVDSLERGIKTKPKLQVKEPTLEILQKIDFGEIPVETLTDIRRDLNAIRGDPETLKGAKKLLNRVFNAVDDTVETFGKDEAPEFLNAYRSAIEVDRGLHQSNAVSSFIKNKADLRKMRPDTLAIFGAVGGPKALGGAAAVTAGATALETAQRSFTNPTIRKHYLNVIRNAQAQNAAGVTKNLSALNKALEQEERNNK